MIKHPFGSALSLTLLLTLSACTPVPQSQPREPLTVSVWQVKPQPSQAQRDFNGRVVAADLTQLAFRVNGKVEAILTHAGASVHKDQVLARLENSTQQQNLNDAQAKFALITRQLERAKTLSNQGAISADELDELSANWRLAKANVDAAKAQLSYTELKAPFDGVIAELNKEAFETLSPAETVATLYRNDRLDVQLAIPDQLLSQLRADEQSKAVVHSGQLEGHSDRLAFHYREHTLELDPNSRSFQVWLSATLPQQPWQLGQPATIETDLSQLGLRVPEGFILPLSALQASDNGEFKVWKVIDHKVYSSRIQVAAITQQGALVSDGLATDDQVVISGFSRLAEQQSVRVQSKEQP